MSGVSESPGRVSALRWVPRALAIAGVLLFLGLLAYGLTAQAPDDTIDQQLAKHRAPKAPAFSLEVLENGSLPPRLAPLSPRLADGKLSLAELRGTPVLLNFWASWCIPCREEAPRLGRGWEKWGKRGVLFLGLDMQDIRSDARNFLREFQVTYSTIRDPGKDVANRYGATGIPETYFISRTSRVVGHVIGVLSTEQLDSGVAAAKAGRAGVARQGGARRRAQ